MSSTAHRPGAELLPVPESRIPGRGPIRFSRPGPARLVERRCVAESPMRWPDERRALEPLERRQVRARIVRTIAWISDVSLTWRGFSARSCKHQVQRLRRGDEESAGASRSVRAPAPACRPYGSRVGSRRGVPGARRRGRMTTSGPAGSLDVQARALSGEKRQAAASGSA